VPILLVAGHVVLATPNADAATSCRARNVTKDRPSRSDLQAVITGADAGDKIAVRGVCVGTFVIPKDLRLVGRPINELPRPTLNARGQGRALKVTAKVRLVHLEVREGHGGLGGGIFNEGTLTLADTIVRRNQVTGEGAGIYNTGDLTLNDSLVTANTATGWASKGGGIYNAGSATLNTSASVVGNKVKGSGGGIYSTGTLAMNDASSVSGNVATGLDGGRGGGIFNAGILTMSGTTVVSGNEADTKHLFTVGGGIYNSTSGTVIMDENASVSGNGSSYGYAGGVLNDGVFTMNGSSSIVENHAVREGGGVRNGGTFTMNDSSSLNGNSSKRGGGIYNDDTVVLNGSSQLAENGASAAGGGVYNVASLTMNDASNITVNRADTDDDGDGTGGGVYGCAVGAVDGGNVNDNYLGSTGTNENNLAGC
jgi:predicted outer membrane repeat protein